MKSFLNKVLQQKLKKLQVKISTLKKQNKSSFFIERQKRETRDMIEATAILKIFLVFFHYFLNVICVNYY
jgi:hypothetical protein